LNQIKSKYEEFLEKCMEGLKERLGEEYTIQVNTILKNNSITLDGVVILKEGAKLTPNIYLDQYYVLYEQGESLTEIIDSILQVYTDKVAEKNDVEIQFDLESMKDKIIFRLVNREKNQELLSGCPYMDYLDLAVTFHCLIQEQEDCIGTIRITNEHVELWGTNTQQLYQYAMVNTQKLMPPLLRRMEDVLREILQSNQIGMGQEEIQMELERLKLEDEDSVDNKAQMYILSNTKGINGAACMLYPDVVSNFARLLKSDVYILPSSIHEIILLPASQEYETEKLEEMVADINQTQVPYEEILSNHIYYYSLVSKQIQILS